jgi:hypothetical protein
MNHHYVYLLIDPRNDGIFYVGQGIGTRAADHVEEALVWDAAGRLPLPATTHKSPEERRAKLLRILDIAATDASLSPQVEFLRDRPQPERSEPRGNRDHRPARTRLPH